MSPSPLASGRFLGTPIRSLESGGARLVQSRYPAGRRLAVHSHERAHFCLVIEGRYEESLLGRTETRTGGALVWYPPGTEHGEFHGSDGTHFLIECCDPSPLRDLIAESTRPGLLSAPEAAGLAGRLHREFLGGDSSPLVLDSLVAELVAEASRMNRPRPFARPAPWLERVRAAIEERFDETLGLGELARLAGVHPSHLAQRFRARYRLTPGEYQRRLRCAFVRRRLVETRDPLVEIALAAGYCDQSHFARAFRRETGLSPGDFRRGAPLGGAKPTPRATSKIPRRRS